MPVKKKPVVSPKKAISPSKPVAQTTPPEAPKKERKKTVRKAPMDRALKRARLLDKNSSAMLRLIAGWHGTDVTADQDSTNSDIVARLRQIAKLAPEVLLDLDMLAKSGFAPVEGRVGGGKEPLAAGARVAIKDKHFNAGLYKSNDFEVVLDAGKQVRIRPAGDLRAPQVDVSRAWLTVLDSTDVDDALDASAIEPTEDVNEDEANQ
jgi:hypothetical protein